MFKKLLILVIATSFSMIVISCGPTPKTVNETCIQLPGQPILPECEKKV